VSDEGLSDEGPLVVHKVENLICIATNMSLSSYPKRVAGWQPTQPAFLLSESITPKGPSKYQCVSELFVLGKDLTSVLQKSIL
jgi:hypothetical protein